MPVKKYRPTSPARRFITTMDFSDLSKVDPEKSLLEVKKKHSGRNNNGHITVRHKGGGTRKQYRIIDFKRTKDAIPAKVATVEYDPNRSCRIALVNYRDGEKRYILAPLGLKVGDVVESAPRPTSKSATVCRSRTFRLVPSFTTSSFAPVKAASSCVRPAFRRS